MRSQKKVVKNYFTNGISNQNKSKDLQYMQMSTQMSSKPQKHTPFTKQMILKQKTNKSTTVQTAKASQQNLTINTVNSFQVNTHKYFKEISRTYNNSSSVKHSIEKTSINNSISKVHNQIANRTMMVRDQSKSLSKKKNKISESALHFKDTLGCISKTTKNKDVLTVGNVQFFKNNYQNITTKINDNEEREETLAKQLNRIASNIKNKSYDSLMQTLITEFSQISIKSQEDHQNLFVIRLLLQRVLQKANQAIRMKQVVVTKQSKQIKQVKEVIKNQEDNKLIEISTIKQKLEKHNKSVKNDCNGCGISSSSDRIIHNQQQCKEMTAIAPYSSDQNSLNCTDSSINSYILPPQDSKTACTSLSNLNQQLKKKLRLNLAKIQEYKTNDF